MNNQESNTIVDERELLLLGLLRQANMHGYQLHEFIEANMTLCTDLKRPTVYSLLDRMADKGWLSFEMAQEGNRPPRRVYRLTSIGEHVFQAMLVASLSTYTLTRIAGDVGLAFLDALPPKQAAALLRQRRRAMAAAHQALLAVPKHRGSLQLVIEHQRHVLATELDWLDALIARLESAGVTQD
ncbi:MAG: PadR family transcriptional regulator [Thermoflexales bacterium]